MFYQPHLLAFVLQNPDLFEKKHNLIVYDMQNPARHDAVVSKKFVPRRMNGKINILSFIEESRYKPHLKARIIQFY
jgi:hypothetical protein